jgi:DNA end-binding protein Ku
MRSMWKGSISFGLVMIPVKLYAATEQKDIAFRQVHRDDGGRIRFRRVCSIDGQEVAYEDIAKGYELPSGEMVVLTDEDMADLPLPSTRSIEVLHFMPAEQLDPILLSRSYFVEPESTGSRAYVLLRDSLEQSGKVALAMVALRQRESLATLRSRDGVLVLETLLWPDEVREAAFSFLDEDIEVRSQELKMAASLIDSMTADFDPDEYHDNYREALQELVDAKIEGREVVQPEEGKVAEGEPTSLTDALQASLTAAREGPGKARPASGGTKTGGRQTGGAKDGAAKAAGMKAAGTKAAGTKTAGPKTAKTSRTSKTSQTKADAEESTGSASSSQSRSRRRAS